jgi:hypothetical protein
VSSHTQATGGISAIALTPDQSLVITAGQDKKITYWDLREPIPAQVIDPAHGIGGEATCLAVRTSVRVRCSALACFRAPARAAVHRCWCRCLRSLASAAAACSPSLRRSLLLSTAAAGARWCSCDAASFCDSHLAILSLTVTACVAM